MTEISQFFPCPAVPAILREGIYQYFCNMSDEIINKVAESGILTIDLKAFYPKTEIVVFDLKDYLFRGLILKEKDFREALKSKDWAVYEGKTLAITNTADAIIPMWAYMLVTSYAEPFAAAIHFGSEKEVVQTAMLEKIAAVPADEYADKRVVIKGCGDVTIPEGVYVAVTKKLRPVVKSLMFGEPCSTVPVYKAARSAVKAQ